VIESGQRRKPENKAAAAADKTAVGVAVKRVSTQFQVTGLLVATCAFVVLASAFAQSQSQGPEKAPAVKEQSGKDAATIKVGVNVVLVNVTVTDPYQRLVTGLEKDNFRVFDDGNEQEVTYFSSEDVPTSIGVIFDMSGSMNDKVNKAREAAVEFFKTANPQDEFSLVTFNDRAELASRFTSSVEDLQTRMMFTAAHGRTALLDGIYLGLSQMRGAHNAKRALLIISDGGDNHSRYSETDIRNFVKESDVQIYAMGIFSAPGYRPTTEEVNGPSLLQELCDMTGGRVFPVDNLDALPDIATKIGMELRNQYVLGYKPSSKANDGRWRKIKVRMRPPRGLPPLNVFARTGYFAPDH
jgi:Ca-activated chloride channel family protein